MIPKKKLGKTGEEVTIFGLGGEGILRTHGQEKEAMDLIRRALELGVTYFESARAYSGSENYYGKSLGGQRDEIFLTSKSHDRTREGALAHLRLTLSNMKTDHLDLWQVHDVRTEDDLSRIFGPGGAIEAFHQAKKEGLTRYVGVTGHENPRVLKKALDLYDFDTVLMPINPAEPHYNSFIENVLPTAKMKNMGIIGMKVYLRGFATRIPGYTSVEPFLKFALSQGISNVVIGCDNVAQLEENVRFAEKYDFMDKADQENLILQIAPYARDLMYYK